MKLITALLAVGASHALVLPSRPMLRVRSRAGAAGVRMAAKPDGVDQLKQRLGAALLASALTALPIAAPLAAFPEPSFAAPAGGGKQNAPTSAGSRVNKDAESLLRNGLPISNKEVRKLQAQIEQSKTDIKVKRIGAATGEAKEARKIATNQASAILKSVRADEQEAGKKLLAQIDEQMGVAEDALGEQNGQGSVQERSALDRSFDAESNAATALSRLQELMVPAGFDVKIPEEYKGLPVLKGRAEIEFTMKKGPDDDDGKFDIEGKLYDKATVKMVIDGYNAPITGGNFVDLVDKGFYKDMKIQRSDGFVVQTGENDKGGYIPPGSSKVRTIPLEIMVQGDKEPMWGSTIEEDNRGSAATVLPFQSYGALGMARTEFEDDSASAQFFWLLFDSDLTPAGKNLLDGIYTCFGYTTDGADLLADVKEGDIIESAKVVKGLELLQRGD